MYELSFNGLRNSGTFKVASATKSAIQSDPKQIIGKVVTITGNQEVGYGSAGDEPFGVVEQVEYVSTNDDDYLVAVAWGQTFEDIKCAGTENAGEFLACDGTGGVKTSVEHTNCVALDVDQSATLCAIKII
mgnify:CR=1 FL=1